MTKSRLLIDYEIIEISGTKLAVFKNGGEDAYVMNGETAYILNLLREGLGDMEIVRKISLHYDLCSDSAEKLLNDFLLRLREDKLLP